MRDLGLTVYGCEPDEQVAFGALGPRFGVIPTTTSESVSEVRAAAVRTRCISVGHKSELAAPVLRALQARGVEYISTRSIGVDHIDLEAAEHLGITVENVTYAPDGVADFTLMLMLMALRHAQQIVGAAREQDFRLHRIRGKELRELTVGVVGVGRIGGAVVERLQGFGCRVLACGRRRDDVAAQFVPFDVLLARSDVVTLHVPLTVATHHLVGRHELATMKPGAYLVNTGRGGLVDTEALVLALEAGTLGGAALDVVEGEEALFYRDCTAGPVEHRLLLRLQRLPNAIVTPHTAYYTERALHDTVERTLVQCRAFVRGRVSA